MSGTKLTPEKITSPFQLMAAWFSMLVLLAGVLLTAAANIEKPEWAAGYLVVCSTVLILVVVGCVTLMLTRFRPHLQDGKDYAQWLKSQAKYAPAISTRSNKKLIERRQKTVVTVSSVVKEGELLLPLKGCGSVHISNLEGCEELAMKIGDVGISAYLYENQYDEDFRSKDYAEHESIWLGERVSSNYVAVVLKIASEFWPHLKYIHLSCDGSVPPDDVHDEIFLGGSTNTAQRYGLEPWTNEELSSFDSSLSIKELHRLIRAKY